MTVLIHHQGNQIGLVALLVSLQTQLATTDDLYVVDSTPNRSGLHLALLYGTTRCYIFVEVGNYTREQAIEFGRQSAKENNQDGVLVISENTIVSRTFIANLKRVSDYSVFSLTPKVIETPYLRMPSDFSWYNRSSDEIELVTKVNPNCYYQRVNVPFSKDVGQFEETVVVLPKHG